MEIGVSRTCRKQQADMHLRGLFKIVISFIDPHEDATYLGTIFCVHLHVFSEWQV